MLKNEWTQEQKERQSFIDVQVEKETSRKNIHLTYNNQDLLFNFNSNVTWEQINLIYHQEKLMQIEEDEEDNLNKIDSTDSTDLYIC